MASILVLDLHFLTETLVSAKVLDSPQCRVHQYIYLPDHLLRSAPFPQHSYLQRAIIQIQHISATSQAQTTNPFYHHKQSPTLQRTCLQHPQYTPSFPTMSSRHMKRLHCLPMSLSKSERFLPMTKTTTTTTTTTNPSTRAPPSSKAQKHSPV